MDTHGGPLVIYARQWCDTPEDVVQDAFLHLMRQQTTPSNPVGWLYRVVRNEAISASRSRVRRRRRETAVASTAETWFAQADDSRLDAVSATRALEHLSLEQRETIVALLWGGLSYEEIAKLTGSSTSTVHRRYQAGLSALRKKLGVACPQEKNSPKN